MTDPHPEIYKAIEYIHQYIYEPLTLTRLAGHVAYSEYHFARLFKERIGLPPLYYVSSLRLQRAKELLLHTDLSVRDIALEVGQQSLGTFTTRFSERVGVTPSEFRNSTLHVGDRLRSLQGLSDWRTPPSPSGPHATIEGSVRAEVPFEGVILIGLFARPIPEGRPLYGTLIASLGAFALTGVKPGTYYLMATSVPWGMQAREILLPQRTLRTRSREPIIVRPQAAVPHQQVMLHLPRLDDPPILISLPLLMNSFLKRMLQKSHR